MNTQPASYQEFVREFKRLEEDARFSAQGQFEQAKQWRLINRLLSVPSSVLAAISGATALAITDASIFVGVLALIAAGLGAALSSLDAGYRSTQATAAANEYLAIQTRARQIYQLYLSNLTFTQARDELEYLTSRQEKQNKLAEPPARRAYKNAQSNIEEGGQTYEAD
jgi:hypothetical protein